MARGGGVGIEYGKIKLYSAEDNMDTLYEKLEKIMNNWGYPESYSDSEPRESDPTNIDDLEEALDKEEVEEEPIEQIEEEEVEEKKPASPWMRPSK